MIEQKCIFCSFHWKGQSTWYVLRQLSKQKVHQNTLVYSLLWIDFTWLHSPHNDPTNSSYVFLDLYVSGWISCFTQKRITLQNSNGLGMTLISTDDVKYEHCISWVVYFCFLFKIPGRSSNCKSYKSKRPVVCIIRQIPIDRFYG